MTEYRNFTEYAECDGLISKLNAYAIEGWRLIAVVPDGGGTTHCVFIMERTKEEQ